MIYLAYLWVCYVGFFYLKFHKGITVIEKKNVPNSVIMIGFGLMALADYLFDNIRFYDIFFLILSFVLLYFFLKTTSEESVTTIGIDSSNIYSIVASTLQGLDIGYEVLDDNVLLLDDPKYRRRISVSPSIFKGTNILSLSEVTDKPYYKRLRSRVINQLHNLTVDYSNNDRNESLFYMILGACILLIYASIKLGVWL